jgi:hypothetical protein
MLIETDWLNMLMDGGRKQSYVIQADQVRFRKRTPGHLGIVFTAGDANTNNSRGRKQIHPSTGLRDTCLARGRRGTRF